MKAKLALFKALFRSLTTIVGILLIWRGVWYVLDIADAHFFQGSHLWTALAGIVIGLVIIYIPDKDFKEIEKL